MYKQGRPYTSPPANDHNELDGLQGGAVGDYYHLTSADASAVIAHPADTSNPHNTTKAHVGLGNVDNTSDADKPISTATQTALDGKSDTSHVHSSLAAADGSPDPALSADASGRITAAFDFTCEGTAYIDPSAGEGRIIVSSTGSSYAAFLGLADDGTPRWKIAKDDDTESGSDAGSSLVINRYSDGGSALGTALTIDRATGNVGIGTTPTAKLSVDSLRVSGNTIQSKADNTDLLALYGGQWNGGAGITLRGESHATDPDTILFTTDTYVPRMKIDTDGNVGIGTTSPADKLHVDGSVRANEFKTNTTSIVPLSLATFGASPTYSKVLSLPGYVGSAYMSFSTILALVAAGSNAPGTYRASGNLYIVWKQAGTNFHLLVEGDFTGDVYYTWNTTTKTYDLWIDHGGNHNLLNGQAIVTPMSLVSTYQLGQLAAQPDTTGLTAVTLGTLITNT